MSSEKLTRREYESYLYCGALGYTPEEAGEKMSCEADTIRTNIRKVKQKKGWHKISELSACAICEYFGRDYEEVRKEIIELLKSGLMIIFFSLLFTPTNHNELYRTRRNNVVSRCNRSIQFTQKREGAA